ncbi:MAG TPA: efflux RND transporter periplasmic adaptor subunit [Pirellulales bacterium]|nr:efflux RND transporter periplasmic adaptor subunit [Pirellulales bacterium]
MLVALAAAGVVLSLAAAAWFGWEAKVAIPLSALPRAGNSTHAGSSQADVNATKPSDPVLPTEAAANGSPPPPEVRLASPEVAKSLGIELVAVARQAIAETVAASGRVAFNLNHYVELRARTEGIVGRIGVDVGAAVTPAQSLAVIDCPRLGDMKAAYINAMTEQKQLEWNATRLERMAADEAVPGKNLREAQTALAQQQITAANARQQLVSLGCSSDEINSLVVDRETTTELPLVAPWAGTIVGRHAVDGALVERGAPLFDLADLATMWVYLNLYEADIGRVQLGQQVAFAPDGLAGHDFTGRVDWINPEVDPRTRITQVRAEVTNTDQALRANMYGRGTIAVGSPHEGLVVPVAAVQQFRGRPIVFIQQSATAFAVRPITVGIKLAGVWEVLTGVEQGETVVTTGSYLLRSELDKDKLGPAE